MALKIGVWVARGAGLAIALLLCGCYTDFGPVVVEPVPDQPATTILAPIQAGDRINVIVYGEPNLTGFYDVSPAGTLSLPLIGSVRAAGRTPASVEREITGRYRRGNYLQDPKITVSVVIFRPFYVMGEAKNPGQYPYYNGLNVLTAISTAGGLTYRASRSTVLVQRAGEGVWQEFPMLANVLIYPGDLIRVPERFF
jgi:polysaccharide export outer membrane protein